MILQNKCVFIVEDNVQNRVVFQMALIRQGARVDFERRGRDAIDHLRNQFHLDIIVLDLMLADGVSGFDIYDEIRALARYDQIPIVAVSAMDASIGIPKAIQKGFNGFIAKPIDNRLFPKQIARILEGEKVWYAGEQISY